jgi:carboxyl-terminal processing protease
MNGSHMNIKKVLTVLVLSSSLACNFVTNAFRESTPTPLPSPTSTSNSLAPLYTPPQCQHVPVATVPAATALAQPTPFLQTNPEISTALQKEIFEGVINKINEVYVYTDFNGVDWTATIESYRAKIHAGLNTEEFYITMHLFINELGDEHSNFISPVEVAVLNAELAGTGEYVGVGFYMVPMVEKNRIAIISIFPDSPAEHAGLKPHDSVLAIDGFPIVENGVERSEILLGEECSAVVLTVQSPHEAPRDVMLIRQKIQNQLTIEAQLVPTSDGSRIGYISIPTFFDQTIPGQVAEALRTFGELDGLILDNRFNGGGSSSVLNPVLSYFASGIVGHFVSRDEHLPLKVKADPIHNSQTVPLVILVSEDTVSFGEIFSGVLRDVRNARIVGETSLGNVEVLRSYEFKDGSELWIAEESFTPLNSNEVWEQTGIIPDVIAYADWDTFTFENDPSVLAAVQLLGH